MIFAELIFAGVQIRTSQKKLMLIHVCNQNPFTLIFRYYYYSVEEPGGKSFYAPNRSSNTYGTGITIW